MYDRKKLTIKGRFSDVCFLQKMLFRPKDWSFTPPENLLGDHRNHRGKCENRGFSPAQQMDQFYLKISPENEKNDQKTGRWRILKMVEVAAVFGHSDCTSKSRVFKHSPLTFGTLWHFFRSFPTSHLWGKSGEKPFHGEEMGNFWKPPDREPIRLFVCLRLKNMPFFPFYGEEMGNFCMPISQSPNRESHRFPDSLGLENIPLFLLFFKSNGEETGKKKRDR